jgi:hypothetical protein
MEPSVSVAPALLLIVHGYDFAVQRTPVFLRTALAARTTPLRLHVLGDDDGLRGFEEAFQAHATAPSLTMPGDTLNLLSERELAATTRIASFLRSVHPSCHSHGYGYLFLKVLAAELLPTEEKLLVIDPDVIVLGDLAELWREFDAFDEAQLASMAVDQSDRYYYRLQDEKDEVYSAGWRGVPHAIGVNGGVLLLHAARARQTGFADQISALTHIGAAERAAGHLSAFCDLAEQDTLNLAFARRPDLWRPLHIRWNYMATSLGGHALVPDDDAPLNFYDRCENGVAGSRGAPGDLLRCTCGRKVCGSHLAFTPLHTSARLSFTHLHGSATFNVPPASTSLPDNTSPARRLSHTLPAPRRPPRPHAPPAGGDPALCRWHAPPPDARTDQRKRARRKRRRPAPRRTAASRAARRAPVGAQRGRPGRR